MASWGNCKENEINRLLKRQTELKIQNQKILDEMKANELIIEALKRTIKIKEVRNGKETQEEKQNKTFKEKEKAKAERKY